MASAPPNLLPPGTPPTKRTPSPPPSSRTNYDPFLTEVVVTLGTIGVGVVTNAIYDLIKQVIVKQKKHQHIHIQQLDQPDGTHLLVVDIDEE